MGSQSGDIALLLLSNYATTGAKLGPKSPSCLPPHLKNQRDDPTYMSDLLVAGGGDAGLGFVRPLQPVRPHAALLLLLLLLLPTLVLVLALALALTLALTLLVMLVWLAAFLHLCFPEAPLPQETLVNLELLTRLLPAVTALHLQLLDAHLDVLDVV